MKKPSITDALLSLIELVVVVVFFSSFLQTSLFWRKENQKKVVYLKKLIPIGVCGPQGTQISQTTNSGSTQFWTSFYNFALMVIANCH